MINSVAREDSARRQRRTSTTRVAITRATHICTRPTQRGNSGTRAQGMGGNTGSRWKRKTKHSLTLAEMSVQPIFERKIRDEEYKSPQEEAKRQAVTRRSRKIADDQRQHYSPAGHSSGTLLGGSVKVGSCDELRLRSGGRKKTICPSQVKRW